MKTQSILLTIFTGFIGFGLVIFLIRLISAKVRPVMQDEKGVRLSYGIHAAGFLVSGCLLMANAIPVISQGFEIMWTTYDRSFVLEAIEFIATIVGFSLAALVVFYYTNVGLASLLFGNANIAIEVERDNYPFFIYLSAALVGLTILGVEVMGPFLQIFVPHLDVPFYH
ncbi:MAG: hypothetical protein EOP48_13845 [Sphingobacteriales bacterium]|nr:MAG: hypothetical protein EOP48_13845 [Sphingobacteriales bacterium]